MRNSCSPDCRWWRLWWRLFVLSFFPPDILDEILDDIEPVTEGFLPYLYILSSLHIFFNEHFLSTS